MRSCAHAETECTECFKERLRSIRIGASATPSRFISRPSEDYRPRDKDPGNNWERGRAVNATRNMPYLDSSGNAVPVKAFAESRHQYRDQESIAVD